MINQPTCQNRVLRRRLRSACQTVVCFTHSDRRSMSLLRTFLLGLRHCRQPPSQPWTATIETLNLCRPPTRRGTKAGTRRLRPITTVASRWNDRTEFISVCKQTCVDRANLIQLIAPIRPVAWNGVSAKSPINNVGAVSRVVVPVKLGIVNARSVCNKTDVFTDHLTEVNMDLVAITETWLSTGDKDNKTIKDDTC